MPLEERLPEWLNEGSEPPETKKKDGYEGGEKPPAGWFNWHFNSIFEVLRELHEKVFLKEDADKLATKTSVTDHVQDLTAHSKFADTIQTGNDITVNIATTGNVTYKTGMGAAFEVKEDVTGPLRVRFGSWGYKNVKNQKGVNLNNTKAGSILTIRYSTRNDSFILQGEGSGLDLTETINTINRILQM